MARMKAAADRLLSKIVSRKLLAWGFATGFLYGGLIDPDAWVALTCVYVGTQGVHDIVSAVLAARGHGITPRAHGE